MGVAKVVEPTPYVLVDDVGRENMSLIVIGCGDYSH